MTEIGNGRETYHITPSLEQHHGKGPSRQEVAYDKFGENVETDLLVRHSLNDAYWEGVYECDDERKHKCPHWHFSAVQLDADDSKREHQDKNT